MREEEIDVFERWQRLLVSCCKTVEKRLGAMEDSQDILRVAGARVEDGVGVYARPWALFDGRRLVEHGSWGMDFWMAYRELEEGVGLMEEGVELMEEGVELMEEGVELMDQFLGKDAGGEGREGWGKGRDGWCTVDSRWSSWGWDLTHSRTSIYGSHRLFMWK